MGLFDFLKRKTEPPLDDLLSPEEAELAPEIADLAGSLMRLLLSTAGRYAMTADRDLNDSTWEITAFAFGVLCSALEQKGIPWYKSPHVAIRFCDAYMPDYDDTKELARLVLYFGTQPQYNRYVDAGKAAMVRFANNRVIEPTPSDIDDLAVSLGYCG
jgi:hypothetical protein